MTRTAVTEVGGGGGGGLASPYQYWYDTKVPWWADDMANGDELPFTLIISNILYNSFAGTVNINTIELWYDSYIGEGMEVE